MMMYSFNVEPGHEEHWQERDGDTIVCDCGEDWPIAEEFTLPDYDYEYDGDGDGDGDGAG